MQVTIAKALNVKNRLVGEKLKLWRLISANASRLENAKTNYDAKKLWAQYEATVDKLVAVKTAIAKANVSVYDKIYRIAELKSKAAEIQSLDTNEADNQEMLYNRVTGETTKGELTKRVVLFKDSEVVEMTAGLEKEIASLHDEVTAYNYNIQIEIPD
jgi:HAMP domain-containing protein